MTCRKSLLRNKYHNIAVLFYFYISLLPVIFLLLTGKSEPHSLLNMRRTGLMVNSVLIASGTVIVCVIISTFAAMRMQTIFKRDSVFKWFFLIMSPMPSYIYALSYMNLIRLAGKIFPVFLRSRAAGFFPCIFVESMVFLPYAMAAAVSGLEQAENNEWAALLLTDADNAFFRVALPKQLPFTLAMGAVIFVLSITDYAIPSLFQVNVYSMEIFSDYSAAGQSVHSLWLSLPLILIASFVLLISLSAFRNISRPMKTELEIKPEYSKALSGFGNICIALLFLQIILPLISMIPSLAGISEEYVSAWEELGYSCMTGLIAVLITLIPSAAVATALSDEKPGRRSIMMAVSLLPLSVPGVLSGIGVLKFFSDTALYPLRSSLIFPAVGMAIRYMPFSMIIQYGCYLRMDRERINAAELLQPRRGIAFVKVTLPFMAPGLFISSVVVFLLTLGDVGTALMLMIAGKEPLSVKIYNYLHYGSSETVTAFCLVQMAVCLGVMTVLYLLVNRKRVTASKRRGA